jgi:hypothetical protein
VADIERNSESTDWTWPERLLPVVLLLSAALWLVGVAGSEVYPGPNLPSFGGIPEGDGAEPISWQVTVRSADGGMIEVDNAELFGDAPDSQWPNLFEVVTTHADQPEVANWFVVQAESGAELDCSEQVELHQEGIDAGRWTFSGTCGDSAS